MAMPKVSVDSRQNTAPELIVFSIDQSEIAAGDPYLEGKNHGTVVQNGTGDFTITLARASARTIRTIGVVPKTEDLTFKTIETTTTVQVVFANLSGNDTDCDFNITVARFDSSIAR